MNKTTQIIISVMLLASLSACTSVKIPDFANSDEFSEAAAKASGYPNPGAAPQAPLDIRSDSEWDEAAEELMAKKESFSIPDDSDDQPSVPEIRKEMRELKAKVHEYKKDDPKN